MGTNPAPRMSESLRRAQRWYPPTMVAAGLILAAGIAPWGVARGWGWMPSLASLGVLGLLVWWMVTRRAMPRGGESLMVFAWAGLMVLRLITTMTVDALGGARWFGFIGALVCAVPFFVVAWIVWRRLRTPARASVDDAADTEGAE